MRLLLAEAMSWPEAAIIIAAIFATFAFWGFVYWAGSRQ